MTQKESIVNKESFSGTKLKYLVIFFLAAGLVFAVYQLMLLEESIRGTRIITVNVGENQNLIPEISLAELTEKAENSSYRFKTDDKYFSVLENKIEDGQNIRKWSRHFLKGVNIGAALPGKFPSEFPEDFDLYMDWFRKIAEMNSNVIRNYTIFPPVFYEAFAQYNLLHSDKPLYLMHGVWAVETDSNNYYWGDYIQRFQREIKDVIDVIHGRAVIKPRPGHSYGVYASDVSQYTIALLLGREWEPLTVTVTNLDTNLTSFNGNFISLPQGTSMEVWLAKMMDFAIHYETQIYGAQRPVSFVNWLPLDPMYHNTEFIENEKVNEDDNDLEVIDYRKFYYTNLFKAGIYAAYHAYPYYPDYIWLDERYKDGINRHGEKDNYVNYLKVLKEHCPNMPLVIAEYGVPSSRGNSHYAPIGFNQGGHSEEEQARINKILTEDIYDTDCAGAIYFAWIDEWFKHNWLVMDFEVPYENRTLWHNMENPEQNYGIIAYENRFRTVDGIVTDWDSKDKIFEKENYSVSASADASYFYLKFKLGEFDFVRDNLYLAIDTYDKNKGDTKLPFLEKELDRGIEFLVQFFNKDSADILVDDKYSVFSDVFNDYIPVFSSKKNNNGIFIRQLLLSNREREGLLGDITERILHDRSSLKHGNSDLPEHSNADWFWNDNDKILELRLTWHLLNVSDPSTRQVLDDIEETKQLESSTTEGFYIYTFITDKQNNVTKQIPDGKPTFYRWDTWESPVYTVRTKKTFDTFKELFPKLEVSNEIEDTVATSIKNTFSIANWYGNKSNAVSILFKGSSYSQYDKALPILDKYKLKSTFNIVEEWTEDNPVSTAGERNIPMQRLSWKNIKELADADHDIGLQFFINNLIPDDNTTVLNINKSKTRLSNHLGKPVTTFYIDSSDTRISSFIGNNNFIFGSSMTRSEEGRIEINSVNNLLNLNSMMIVNNNDPSLIDFYSYLTGENNPWQIINFSHILSKDSKEMELFRSYNILNTYTVTPDHFERLIRIIRNTDYWIAPVSSVGKYIMERNSSTLEVQDNGDFIFLMLNNSLDKSIFNQPLTVIFETDWNFVKVTNSIEDGVYNPRNNRVYINMLPGNQVILEKLKVNDHR